MSGVEPGDEHNNTHLM